MSARYDYHFVVVGTIDPETMACTFRLDDDTALQVFDDETIFDNTEGVWFGTRIYLDEDEVLVKLHDTPENQAIARIEKDEELLTEVLKRRLEGK